MNYPATLEERKKRLEEIPGLLKKKFRGIDPQINLILKKITFWYLYPEKVNRPLVINLWGPTGVGKTDLIRDIKSLLGLSVYAEILVDDPEGGVTLVESLYDKNEEIYSGRPGVLVLDEFPKFCTRDSSGQAKRNQGYKDIWQILSDGLITTVMSRNMLRNIGDLMQWDSEKGFLEREDMSKVVSYHSDMIKCKDKDFLIKCAGKSLVDSDYNLSEYIKSISAAKYILENYGYPTDGTIEEIVPSIHKLLSKSSEPEFSSCYDFRKNLIVITGNLDSVYQEYLGSNSSFIPADFYHEETKKINIFNIKEELENLFFPEQVARLGNNHVIYPTLREEDFFFIIKEGLENNLKDMCEASVAIDNSLVEFIYRNYVNPTKGVRPVFSSIYEVSNIVTTMILNNNIKDAKVLVIYKDKNIQILEDNPLEENIIDSEEYIGEVDHVLNEIKKHQRFLDFISIHEAGHVVAWYKLTGQTPRYVIVEEKSASTIFMQEYLHTPYLYHSKIITQLAGQAAIETKYGTGMSAGHSDDYREVTRLLIKCRRVLGLVPDLKSVKPNLKALPPYSVSGDGTIGQGDLVRDNDSDFREISTLFENYKGLASTLIEEHMEEVEKIAAVLKENLFLKSSEVKDLLYNLVIDERATELVEVPI